MNKHINISVLVAIAATTALLIGATTLAPAAFAHKSHGSHHSSISVDQRITQINSQSRCDCSDSTQVNVAGNFARIG